MEIEEGYTQLNDLDTEKALIGAVMISPENFLSVNWLKPRCFYNDKHQKVWGVIHLLFEKGLQLDMPTVSQELRKRGEDTEFSVIYITELTKSGVGAENVSEFAQHIYDLYIKRDMYQFLVKMSSEITGLMTDHEDVTSRILEKITKLHDDLYTSDAISAKSVVGEARELILKRKFNEDAIDDLNTNLQNLFIPNGLVIIAARPSMGKSSLAIQLVNNISIDQGIPVALFELEMSKEQIMRWVISQRTEIENERLRKGNISDEEVKIMEDAIRTIEEAPLFIDDTPSLNVLQLRSKAIKLRNKYGIRMVIIDYIQLMAGLETRGKVKNRENEVSEISRQLKVLQKELGVAVVALAQLNREVVSRANKRPQLSDLRESGALEQDADMVIFIHRPEYYGIEDLDGQSTKGLAQLMVEKYRDGALGWKEVKFIPERVTFKNFERSVNEGNLPYKDDDKAPF